MNFISKKYLLSALVICASFSSGFTSNTCYKPYCYEPFRKINTSHTDIKYYNKYDPYFRNISYPGDLLLKKLELQDMIKENYADIKRQNEEIELMNNAYNKIYERLVTPKKNNKYQTSNSHEHNNTSNIDDLFNNPFELFNKTFNEFNNFFNKQFNSFSDWFNIPFNNIWQGCNQILQKFGEHFSSINKCFNDIMNQCIKQNKNHYTETIYDKNNNLKGYRRLYIDKSNNNNRYMYAYSYYNNNIYPNQNNDDIYENNIVEDNSLDKTRDEDDIKKELEQLEKDTNEIKNLNKTNNNSILIYPNDNKDNNTQNINQQSISNSEWDNIEDDLINNGVFQNANSINPVLDNKTSVVMNNNKKKVNKISDIDKKKLHKYNANKNKNNKNYKVINAENVQINSNEVNNFYDAFNDCTSKKELDETKNKLLKLNEEKSDRIEKECDKKIEALEKKKDELENEYDNKIDNCNDNKRAKQLEKAKEALLEEKDKEIYNLEKAKEKALDEIEKEEEIIEKAYDKAFENLFDKIYNDLLSKNIKDKSIIENLINNKEIVFFHSLDPKDVQNFINLQKAVQEIMKDPKNTEALNAEKNNKFLEYVKTCNKEQSNNISMLYYQIYLNLSGKINSEKKIDQTLDLFGLKDLLLDFNDKTLADEDSYYNNLNNELIYAVINDYRDSNTSIDLYIKQLSNNQDNILKKYSQQYKKRISTIFDKRIDKQTDAVLRNYEIEEKNKSLQMLDNIKAEQWNKATEAADKYLKAFDILVNIVNQYK